MFFEFIKYYLPEEEPPEDDPPPEELPDEEPPDEDEPPEDDPLPEPLPDVPLPDELPPPEDPPVEDPLPVELPPVKLPPVEDPLPEVPLPDAPAPLLPCDPDVALSDIFGVVVLLLPTPLSELLAPLPCVLEELGELIGIDESDDAFPEGFPLSPHAQRAHENAITVNVLFMFLV